MESKELQRNKCDIESIMNELLFQYKENPVDLLSIGDHEREYAYISRCMNTYIRTVNDIAQMVPENRESKKILEIGSFLGIVSIALSRLGFNVTASDVPEYISCKNLQSKFNDNHVDYIGCNLRDYNLPFNDEEFDIVIMCETLEHLNFNPLPVIKEINRVLKRQGLFYITVPNIARKKNRLKLIRGESILNPVDDFFLALNGTRNTSIGIHWREYTRNEIKEILERMNFAIIKQEYEKDSIKRPPGLKGLVIKVIRYFLHLERIRRLVIANLFDPGLDSDLIRTLITFASKSETCAHKFCIKDLLFPESRK